MSYQERISAYTEDRIGHLVINRPERRNAIDLAMWRQIRECLAYLEQQADVLIIRGEGGTFTAGCDLEELAALSLDEVETAFQTIESGLAAAEHVRIPTIAAVCGHALGAGLFLAMACDVRLVARGARMGAPVARLGITVTPNLINRFVGAVGADRARELLLTGRLAGAHEAYRLGMAHQVVEPAALVERAVKLAHDMQSHSPASLRAAKKVLAQVGPGLPWGAQIWHTDPTDFPEGVSAFLEKRRPQFRVVNK